MSLFAMDIINISGKVVSESGEELIGANVSIVGGSSGTATDASGNYRFDLMKREVENPFFLKASYIGYQSLVDTIQFERIQENSLEINFSLPADVMRLESVVVTGFGIQQEGFHFQSMQWYHHLNHQYRIRQKHRSHCAS